MIKNVILFLAAAGIGFAFVACSSSSSTGGAANDTAVNEFSSLPEVTGPVTTASTRSNNSLAATTGVALSSPGTFTSGMSVQMCENVNILKEIMREASQPDKILCYMSKMKSSGVIPSSLDVADGEVKYIKLTNLPNERRLFNHRNSRSPSEPRVKFQIVKTGDQISSFKMWSCFGGSSSPTQSEYVEQAFTGNTVTVLTKNVGSEGTASYGSSVTASGDYSSTTGWTSKNVNGMRYFNDTGNGWQNSMTLDMNQYSDRLDLSIAMNGESNGDTFTNRFYTIAQLLGDKLSNFAIGDGSSKAEMSYDQNSDGVDHTFSSTFSWNGDTRMNLGDATTGDHYSLAHAGTVPTAPNATDTVTFTGDQVWDCEAPSEGDWVSADFNDGGTAIQTGMQECNDKFLNGGSWIQCPY